MQNLDAVFLEAKARSASWPLSTFRYALDKLAADYPMLELSWDEWCGEDWATFSLDDTVIVLLRKDVPLAFVAVGYYKIGLALQSQEVKVVFMSSWDTEEFSLSAYLINHFHEWTWRLSPGNGIDMTRFSAWDLWWATI